MALRHTYGSEAQVRARTSAETTAERQPAARKTEAKIGEETQDDMETRSSVGTDAEARTPAKNAVETRHVIEVKTDAMESRALDKVTDEASISHKRL